VLIVDSTVPPSGISYGVGMVDSRWHLAQVNIGTMPEGLDSQRLPSLSPC